MYVDVLECLLECLTKDDINAQNSSGNTAMHWAALNGHVDVVKRLAASGADPTVCFRVHHHRLTSTITR